jgi:acetylglutamate kinase
MVANTSAATFTERRTDTLRPLVLKFGGELLEAPARVEEIASAVAEISSSTPLVIVHGGGKEIDAALKTAGIQKRQVDGLRITDDQTLDVVVAVLAGAVNTRFVAALTLAGIAAVGLTGADGSCGLADVAPPHRTLDGQVVDLGAVGVPSRDASMRLLLTLVADRFVPVLACIGLERNGRLLNVNADTFAGHLAARLRARRLVIAGTTPGVLGTDGATIGDLRPESMAELLANKTATAGMVAKLRACQDALDNGVGDVVIVDGRRTGALIEAARSVAPGGATLIRA